MARIVLVTGGCRSGKSHHALKITESFEGRRLFIATCQIIDQEMEERVALHQKERKQSGWETVEEPLDLFSVLDSHRDYHTVVVDCLTLWIGNLMHETKGVDRMLDESEIAGKAVEVINSCRGRQGVVVFVTNEVGMGLVPDNPLGRRFRDLTGRCNQVFAEAADRVVCMISGMPLILKG